MVVRVALFGRRSGDYTGFLSPWFDVLERDGLAALGTDFSNYAPTYLYGLWLATFLPVSKLVAVKLLSVFFDVVMATAGAWLVREFGGSWFRALVGFAFVLFAPTVVVNGAGWGQCDAGYTMFLVAGLALLRRGNFGLAALSVGAAVAFKAQGVFLLPLILVLCLHGIVQWRLLLLLPVPYAVSCIVPLLYGRPPMELALVYVDQATTHNLLTLNAPTLYAWLHIGLWFSRPAVILGGLIIFGVCLASWRWTPFKTRDVYLPLAAFFLVLSPFVLPRMHERYFFAADVVTILYGVMVPNRLFVAALVSAASLFSYAPYLRGFEVVPLEVSALLMAIALVTLASDVFPGLRDFASRKARRLRPTAATSSD